MKIEDLEKALQYFVIAVPESEEQAKAYFWARKAITALRSMQEAGEPLSVEQLKQMYGNPVWVVCFKKEKYIDPPIGWRILEKSISGSFGVWNGENCLSQRSYGSDWLAYPYPPAHIDRSKWEACELCSLPDGKSASRLIIAETCNGEAKYCPRCGRPLTKAAWAELERRLRG